MSELRDSAPEMVALDQRLAAVIKGVQQPKDNAERLSLAQRAYEKALHGAAAQLWADALEADPKLADDRRTGHRYNAACAAALAAVGAAASPEGKGRNEETKLVLDAETKSRLRREALEWLRAELTTWTQMLDADPARGPATIVPILQHWKADADLAGIRDEKELTKLPHDERAALVQLWNDVNQLMARARGCNH
jgi:hypothetical protein